MKRITIVLVGKSGVGKTVFLTTASRGRPPRHPVHSTIGIENVTFRRGRSQLQCWDASGNDKFKQVVPMFLKNCDVAIYMYRPEDTSTLDVALDWYNTASALQDGPPIHIFLANTSAPVSTVPRDRIPPEILLVGSATKREDVEHILNGILQHALLSPQRESTYSSHSLTRTQVGQCCGIQ